VAAARHEPVRHGRRRPAELEDQLAVKPGLADPHSPVGADQAVQRLHVQERLVGRRVRPAIRGIGVLPRSELPGRPLGSDSPAAALAVNRPQPRAADSHRKKSRNSARAGR
jgi:hypothetical protein